MRAGACTVQQTLTSEAASVLKHSLSLARRRGHAQITPLHVAATFLTSRVSLLRRACLKSQPHQTSHPLQCRALELCFNVALNRLPTTPGPILHGQPSLSNALIAALKRAQAHQRRGCIEQQQQQPLLAIKVELEQLILSILDDPSVSRIMREAGFSSTAVKNNLDGCSLSSVFQCYNSSGGIYSTPCSPPSETTPIELINPSGIWHSPFMSSSSEQNPILFPPQKKLSSTISSDSATCIKEDLKLVVEVLLQKKRRNTVIVGDSLFIAENLVAELMGKVERGDVPEVLKLVHFIKFHFSAATLRLMKREEVEVNISDLKREVGNLVSGGRGVIIYAGDLKWTVETLSEGENGCKLSFYSPVDHLVAEIGKLLSFYSSSDRRIWLLATANYQTYMRCQMKKPALDIHWDLQAVSVPSGGLGLSLHSASVRDTSLPLSQSKYQGMEKSPFAGKEEQDVFSCCPQCSSTYEKELGSNSAQQKSSPIYSHFCNAKDIDKTSNELPYLLKPTGINVAEKDDSVHLKRKWSKLCQSLRQGKQSQDQVNHVFSNLCSLGKNYSHNSCPCWPSYNRDFVESKSISFANASLRANQSLNSVPRFRRQQSCHIEFNFSNGHSKYDQEHPNLDSLNSSEDKEVKITLALGSSLISDDMNYVQLKSNKGIQDSVICELLKKNVPWQSGRVPRIVEALMDSETKNKDIWLLFLGNDSIGKQKLALGLAESVFGSADLLFEINIRKKDRSTGQYSKMLESALRDHDRMVILLHNVDHADHEFLKFLADGWRSGKICPSSKKEESPCQTIFILTKLDAARYGHGRGKTDSVIQMKLLVNETTPPPGIFSSVHKLKAEWDFTDESKSPRQGNMEYVLKFAVENGKKKLTSESSLKTLDLNMKAEVEENEAGSEEFSPISSDLTTNDRDNSLGFLSFIKNSYIFNRDSTDDNNIREALLSKIEGSFRKVFGGKNQSCFTVEEDILEEIFLGSGSFLDSLFEKWLEDIFETSLISIGRMDGINIRLCLGGRGDQSDLKEGFEGSRLPKNVQLSFLN